MFNITVMSNITNMLNVTTLLNVTTTYYRNYLYKEKLISKTDAEFENKKR